MRFRRNIHLKTRAKTKSARSVFGRIHKKSRLHPFRITEILLRLHKYAGFSFLFVISYGIMVILTEKTRHEMPGQCERSVRLSADCTKCFMADYRSSGKELRRSPKGAIAAMLAVLMLAGGGAAALKISENLQPVRVLEDSSAADLSVPDITDTTTDKPRTLFIYETKFASDVHNGPLMLVNRSTPLPEDPKEDLVPVFSEKNEYLHVKDVSVQLHKDAMQALNDLATGFYNATGESSLLVLSGFRTKEYQRQLYEADLEKTGQDASALVAEPGCSEHETGYAFDLSLYLDGVFADFDGTGVYDWVGKHCAEYGFILRYPKDKVTVTGFSHEPWHFRYVGIPHALYMRDHNLCLEEYMGMLQDYTYEGTHLEIPDQDGNICEVFYVLLADAINESVVEIPVAADLPYTVSGNNRGAFIVTVYTGRPMESETETTARTDGSSEAAPETTEAE